MSVGTRALRAVFFGLLGLTWIGWITASVHTLGVFALVAAVIVLSVQLIAWYDATPNYVLMTFAVVIVLLMNQAEVRDAFGEDAGVSAAPR